MPSGELPDWTPETTPEALKPLPERPASWMSSAMPLTTSLSARGRSSRVASFRSMPRHSSRGTCSIMGLKSDRRRRIRQARKMEERRVKVLPRRQKKVIMMQGNWKSSKRVANLTRILRTNLLMAGY